MRRLRPQLAHLSSAGLPGQSRRISVARQAGQPKRRSIKIQPFEQGDSDLAEQVSTLRIVDRCGWRRVLRTSTLRRARRVACARESADSQEEGPDLGGPALLFVFFVFFFFFFF